MIANALMTDLDGLHDQRESDSMESSRTFSAMHPAGSQPQPLVLVSHPFADAVKPVALTRAAEN